MFTHSIFCSPFIDVSSLFSLWTTVLYLYAHLLQYYVSDIGLLINNVMSKPMFVSMSPFDAFVFVIWLMMCDIVTFNIISQDYSTFSTVVALYISSSFSSISLRYICLCMLLFLEADIACVILLHSCPTWDTITIQYNIYIAPNIS